MAPMRKGGPESVAFSRQGELASSNGGQSKLVEVLLYIIAFNPE